MEEWFKEIHQVKVFEGVQVKVQAYADDQLIMIRGASLRRIEAAWEAVWEACLRWSSDHKLEYAYDKTTVSFGATRVGERPG